MMSGTSMADGENARMDREATGLVLVAASLMALGLVMLFSTQASLDRPLFDSITWQSPPLRQAVFVACGMAVMLVLSRIGPGFLRWRPGKVLQPSVMFMLAALGLLAAVYAPGIGHESHGKHRWIMLGPIGFQPSELAKPALVVFLAAMLSRPSKYGARATPDLSIPMLAVGAVCYLVGREDFGTAVLLAGVAWCMVVVRGCPLMTLAAWSVPVVGAFFYLLMSQTYRIVRLLSFVNIWDDAGKTDYHAVQSLAAIAAGGWTGKGLGAGLAKYGYLPEGQTDFIFAIICEEAGFVGGVLVILLYAVFVLLGLRVLMRAPSGDGGFFKLFAFGVTVTLALQALMNVAVVTVVAPTKGIGLPLVSSGGSGLLCFCAAVGLLAGTPRLRVIDARRSELPLRPSPGLLIGGCP